MNKRPVYDMDIDQTEKRLRRREPTPQPFIGKKLCFYCNEPYIGRGFKVQRDFKLTIFCGEPCANKYRDYEKEMEGFRELMDIDEEQDDFYFTTN